MERIYVRLAPGHVARGRRRGRSRQMGKTLADELPEGSVELVLTNVGSPQQRAQRDDQPQLTARTWASSASRSPTPRSARSRSARSPTGSREILNRALPRRRVPAVARAASSRACSRTATSRRSSSRCAATTSRSSTQQAKRRRRGRAHASPGVRDVRVVARRSTTPRSASRPTARRRAWSASRARDAAQTTLEATLGNINTPSVWIDPANGQSYYVVTSYDGSAVADPERARADPGARRRRRASRSRSAPTATIRRSVGPDRDRAQPAPARRARAACRPRGATSAAPPADLETALDERPAHARHRRSTSSARSS